MNTKSNQTPFEMPTWEEINEGEKITPKDVRKGDVIWTAIGPVRATASAAPTRHPINAGGQTFFAPSVVLASRDESYVRTGGDWTIQGNDYASFTRLTKAGE